MVQDWKDRLVRTLLWSQKYTKTDMVYLARGGFWLTLGQAVTSLSALALAIAFANLVPPETYGTYKYLLSIAGVFAIFTLPGMNMAFARAVAQGHEGLISSITRSRVAHSFLGSAVALAGSGYYFLNENLELSLALLVIAATLPVFDTTTGYLSYLLGKRRFDLQTTYHLLTQAVSVAVLIGTIFFTHNIILILLAYFVPLILVRGFLYFRTVRAISKDEAGVDETRETHTYGKHLTAMQILAVISGNIDKILLWKFFGPTQLAIYAFALAIPEQIKGPLKGVGELAFPKFAAQTPEQIRASLPALFRKIGLYALGLLAISVVYILAAPYIFALLFPQYMESVLYSQIFALSLVTGASSIALAILSAQKKTTVQYAVTTVQPLITVALLLFLVPLYGVMGAILALVASRFIAAFIFLGSLFTLK
ncbi:MAG TPA: oligosaccharide flippase family protein [Candidatus Paceibacterota bacterium]|nr:oligosaccharide flippase family protein [Candidatus Paceibacterota bacterium]